MSLNLYSLEKISSITDELAVYTESGELEVVLIEKITIEPGIISFALKSQRGQLLGLENQKAFTVSSTFEFLEHSDGQFTSSINSWVLETDPLKVIYLSNMIKGSANVDEILSVMRNRQVSYDDETTKVLSRLMSLKRQIKNRKILLASEPEFKGQSWGGAGVMVISNDEGTKKQYSHFHGITVVSDHAPQIGELFRRVHRITATCSNYNHISKHEFWGSLADAANSLEQEHSSARLEEVCDKVIMTAIKFVTQDPSH